MGLLLYCAYNHHSKLTRLEEKHRALTEYLKVSPTETSWGGCVYRQYNAYSGMYPDHSRFEQMVKEVEEAINERKTKDDRFEFHGSEIDVIIENGRMQVIDKHPEKPPKQG